jgi:hypothetical protein
VALLGESAGCRYACTLPFENTLFSAPGCTEFDCYDTKDGVRAVFKYESKKQLTTVKERRLDFDKIRIRPPGSRYVSATLAFPPFSPTRLISPFLLFSYEWLSPPAK